MHHISSRQSGPWATAPQPGQTRVLPHHTVTAYVAGLALALGLGLAPWGALAQSQSQPKSVPKPAAKTSANKSARNDLSGGDKIMTRQELRACLQEDDALATRRQQILAERQTLDDERAVIVKERDALKAAAETLDRSNADAVNAHNERVRANDATIESWNPKNSATVQKAQAYQGDHDQWKARCGNRRFNEDDEKAIRAGK
jgi:hypothetical protein